MPADDLVINVRQIAGYTPTSFSQGDDSLLIQRGGLGGPYFSILSPEMVSTALASGGLPLFVGTEPPTAADGGQIFSGGFCSTAGEGFAFNAYVNAAVTGIVAMEPGFGGQFAFNPSTGTFVWNSGPGTGAGSVLALQTLMILGSGGNLDLPFSTLTVAQDPIAPMEVATARYVDAGIAASVVQFNGRSGFVMLNIDDIICAGGAPIWSPVFQGSPLAPTPSPSSSSNRIATTAFVQAALAVEFAGFAPIDSPAFTGVPTAPTAAQGSADGQLATTAFVTNAVAESTAGVASFNGRTGVVALVGGDITAAGGALLASPVFTGTPSAPTQPTTDNSTRLATTAFVLSVAAPLASPAFTGVPTAPTAAPSTSTGQLATTAFVTAAIALGMAGTVTTFNGRSGAVNLIGNDVSAAGGALTVSPAFTGTPTAPTAAPNTSNTQIATCAFVAAAVATSSGVLTFNGRAGAVTLTAADVSGVGGALLASPAFTLIPTAPTAAPGTNTAQLATCAFVQAAVSAATAGVASFNGRTGAVSLIASDVTAVLPASTINPTMNGVASPGTLAAWARGDHVHPTDTSLYPASNPSGFQTAAQVTASLANYLPLAGGTLTGTLNAQLLNAQATTVTGGLQAVTGGIRSNNGGAIVISVATVADRMLFGQTGTVNRWGLDLGTNQPEIGSSQGSNFALYSYGDGGTVAFTPMSIVRNSGVTTFSSAIVNGPSDRSLKENVAPLDGALDKVMALQGVSFNMIATPSKVEIGLIAQDVEPVVPEVIQDFQTFEPGRTTAGATLLAIDYSRLTALLIEAVKTLAARVEVLEAAR